MSDPTKPAPIIVPPGINRDAPYNVVNQWIDGQWVRFYDERPQKMGGYAASDNPLNPTVRMMNLEWGPDTVGYLHAMGSNGIDRVTINSAGAISNPINSRTPLTGFTPDAANVWSCGTVYDAAGTATSIVAHCVKNLEDIGAGVDTPIYSGDISATTPLVDCGTSIDGGVMCAGLYTIAFGSDGQFLWSQPNKVLFTGGSGSSAAGAARITGSKLVAGMPIKVGNTGTSALLWSLNNIMLARYVGGTTIWDTQQVASDTSILSTRSIVEYDGVYYWPGVDNFMKFDGQKSIFSNTSHRKWFFDNLNYDRRQCVWGMVNPKYEEIVWFAPLFGATECSHYLVWAVGESKRTGRDVWYSGALARSYGIPPKVFRYPLMTDYGSPTRLWQHEKGVDKVIDSQTFAIDSYVKSSPLALPNQSMDNWVYIDRLEIDAKQTGNMTLTMEGRKYPRSTPTSEDFVFTDTAETVDLRKQFRYMQFQIRSNVVGGNYEFGKPVAHLGPQDSQQSTR